jgi:uncharacterized protein YqcC (DUF446 family)
MHKKTISVAELSISLEKELINLEKCLMSVEKELRELHLWEFESPPADALASTSPFAIDTLNFPQWLQFIFLARLELMVQENLPLPSSCSVAPMAEQYFNVLNLNSATLIAYLKNIDELLTHKSV